MDEDMKLIEEFKSGEKKAFESLVQKYKNAVYSTAYGILNNENDAEDAAQEVFMKVFFSINSFKYKSSFSTWLYKITANKAIDKLKGRKNELSLDSDVSMENVAESHNSDAQIPEILKINTLLKKLPPKYKTAIVLKELRNLKYSEIASAMNISVDNVKVLLFRARNMLKKLSEGLNNELQ